MKQYSFYSTDLLIDGVMVTGFSEGNSIISAAFNSPQQGHMIGARGEMAVFTSANKSGRMSFSLMQTSDWNEILNERALLNRNTGLSGNRAIFEPLQVMLNDKQGETIVTGINGYIPAIPAIVRGTGLNTLTWTIMFEEIVFARGTYENAGL